MAIKKFKPTGASPTFEKLNLERMKKCMETSAAAKRAIDTSKRLTEESQNLIEELRHNRPKHKKL